MQLSINTEIFIANWGENILREKCCKKKKYFFKRSKKTVFKNMLSLPFHLLFMHVFLFFLLLVLKNIIE